MEIEQLGKASDVEKMGKNDGFLELEVQGLFYWLFSTH